MKSFEDIVAPFKDRLQNIDYKNIKKDFNPTIYLFQSWAYKVEKGWYGIDLPGVPFVWALIIDKFLDELNKVAPEFKIHQIKLKMGGLRFYVDDLLTDPAEKKIIRDQIDKLENTLYSEDLIY